MSQLQQSQSQRMYAQPKMLAEYAAPSFWIRYKPDRLQKRTNRILSFLISLGIAAVAASFFTWRNDGYFILNGYLFLLITAFVLMIVSGPLKRLALVILPNHIELNEKGLRFHWMHLFLRASTPLINWERVSHVTTKITKVADVEEVTLEFNAIARGFTMKERLLYFMLAPALSWGWLTSDRAQIHFKVDGIASSDDRKRLQTGLKKFLPSYRIDPKVADDLNIFIKFDSYTDLWLDKLQDSSESDRKAALEDGAVLNNGEYKILEQIGAGGQAIVYRALMFKKLADSAALMSLTRGETRVDLDDLAGLKQESSKKSQPAVQKETSNDGAVETPEKLPVTVATEN